MDEKLLFYAKYNICTNFELDLDTDVAHQLTVIDDQRLQEASLGYSYLQTAVNNLTRPFIFYTGMKNISALDQSLVRINKSLHEKISKFGLNFYLLEPLSTYNIEHSDRFWYCHYDHQDISKIKSLELDSIERFSNSWHLNLVRVYSAEHNIKNIFEKKYKNLSIKTKLLYWPFGVSGRNFKFDNKEIIKKFWSGNKRYSVHRHIVASYLIATVPQSMLNISWFSESNIDHLKDSIDIEEFGDKKKYILKGSTQLDKLSPITFDLHLKTKIPMTYNYKIEFSQQSTDETYKECFCAVITETRFFQYSSIMSEKIINAILNKKFFIVVGPPRTLHYLKLFGIKTFSQWIDESYDEELNHTRRLQKILDVIEFVNKKDITELQLIYKKMEDVILHNLKRAMIFDRYWRSNKLQNMLF